MKSLHDFLNVIKISEEVHYYFSTIIDNYKFLMSIYYYFEKWWKILDLKIKLIQCFKKLILLEKCLLQKKLLSIILKIKHGLYFLHFNVNFLFNYN